MMVSRCHGVEIEVVATENGDYFECNKCRMPCETKISFMWDIEQKELMNAVI